MNKHRADWKLASVLFDDRTAELIYKRSGLFYPDNVRVVVYHGGAYDDLINDGENLLDKLRQMREELDSYE